ncbi:hypothetical protein AMJ47_01030, partial [Parcubacteria bacterium DG_72]
PITGEPIQVGDFVLGTIDKTIVDGSLHGLWVKWETVKEQLMNEIYANLSMGGLLTTATDGTKNMFTLPEDHTSVSDSFIAKIKQALSYLGLVIENGVARVKGIFAEKVVTNEIELVDKATGEKYCTWIENGEWVKQKGECFSENNQLPVSNNQNVDELLERHYCDEGYAEECTDPDSCRLAGLYWYEGDCWAQPLPDLPAGEAGATAGEAEPVLETETLSTQETFDPEPVIQDPILETETPINQ